MTATYQSSGTAKGYGTATTVPAPAGITAGDIILIVAISGGINATWSWPTGFTEIANPTRSNLTLGVAWKRAQAADGDYTMSPSSGSWAAQAHRFSGVIGAGSPVRQTPDATTSAPSEPSVSLSGVPAGDLLVHIAGCNNQAKTISTPAGYTARGTTTMFALQTKAQATTGDTGSVSGGTSTALNPFGAILFSLAPSPQLDVLDSGSWVTCDVLGVGDGSSLIPVEVL